MPAIRFISLILNASGLNLPGKKEFFLSFHQWLYLGSNLLVGLACFIIPLIILIYSKSRSKNFRFNRFYWLFGGFIFFIGAGYLADNLIIFTSFFYTSIFIRLITGILSCITIFYILKLLPFAFSLKDPKEFEEEIERRLKAEEQLKAKNERLLEAERTARLGHGSWDIIRHNLEFSPMVYEILDIPAGSVLNYKFLSEIIHPADLHFVEDHIYKNLETGDFKEFYCRIVTPAMKIKHLLVKGKIRKNSLGQPLEIRGTIQDVSELRRYIHRVENQNKRLNKIAWIQSHKMRSPVATMLGMINLLNYSNPGDPANKEILKNIHDLTQKLDEMIHEVDEITREKPAGNR